LKITNIPHMVWPWKMSPFASHSKISHT
jgi:hypothetical protein